MPAEPSNPNASDLPEEINGLRMTKQRREVFKLLADKRTHPTAQEVFLSVKGELPSISLATVYNCLEALVQHQVIRKVNFDRESSRYCSNLADHGHLHDEATGSIQDVQFKEGVKISDLLDLPAGFLITDCEITLRGKSQGAESNQS